jgi:hypothetical protein
MNYQRIYANVMERCMRQSPGHVVRIDRLLLHARGDVVMAEYRASTVNRKQVFRVIQNDVLPLCLDFDCPKYEITPHGDLKSI